MDNTDANHIPKHIAIIADGNRRWAKKRGLPAFEGHRRGFNAIQKISKKARKAGVRILSVWVFSTENWKRTGDEVGYLMKLFEQTIDKELKEAIKEKTRIVHLGRKDRIPPALRKKIMEAEEKTKHFDEFYFVVALDYGGRDEITRAVNQAYKLNTQQSSLQEEDIHNCLDTAHLPYPDPDLIIRPGGEHRLSGFMLWQCAYSELIFSDKFCPEFDEKEFELCLAEYASRQRRYGK